MPAEEARRFTEERWVDVRASACPAALKAATAVRILPPIGSQQRCSVVQQGSGRGRPRQVVWRSRRAEGKGRAGVAPGCEAAFFAGAANRPFRCGEDVRMAESAKRKSGDSARTRACASREEATRR